MTTVGHSTAAHGSEDGRPGLRVPRRKQLNTALCRKAEPHDGRLPVAVPGSSEDHHLLPEGLPLTVLQFLNIPGLDEIRFDVLKPPEELGNENHDVRLKETKPGTQ